MRTEINIQKKETGGGWAIRHAFGAAIPIDSANGMMIPYRVSKNDVKGLVLFIENSSGADKGVTIPARQGDRPHSSYTVTVPAGEVVTLTDVDRYYYGIGAALHLDFEAGMTGNVGALNITKR